MESEYIESKDLRNAAEGIDRFLGDIPPSK